MSTQLNTKFNQHVAKAEKAYEKNNLTEAVEEFQKALQLIPNSFQARLNLAITLDRLRQDTESLKLFEQLYNENPKHALLLVNFGIFYAARGDFDRAIDFYEKHLELEPESVLGYKNISKSYANQGAYRLAVLSAQKAFSLQPDDLEAQTCLGIYLSLNGKIDEGIDHLQRAYASNRNYAEAVIGLCGSLQLQMLKNKNLHEFFFALFLSIRSFFFLPVRQEALGLFLKIVSIPWIVVFR